MDAGLEQRVRERARGACEYCRLPEAVSSLPHVIDHVIARQHGGPTEEDNLALCCGRCNLYKGTNIAGLDRATGHLVPLFHPRRDSWEAHFRWEGPTLVGLTATGRATVEVLAINSPGRVALRRVLMSLGQWAP